MQFKSYHLRWGVLAIGGFMILYGAAKGIFGFGMSEQMERWLMSSLFISAVVLYVYMKKYKIKEAEEEKTSPGPQVEPENKSGIKKPGSK